ncbi:MAG: hypothetical protein PHW79_00770 [Candidatus Marinimicrobia bacterium]|nr:hypothetical protein [Candidatus Neomarinimicrobiota bacterium]
MKCDPKLINKVCDYLGGDLNSEPCQIIKEHIEKCHNCDIFIDKIKKTVEIYQKADSCDCAPENVTRNLFLKLDLCEPKKSEHSK